MTKRALGKQPRDALMSGLELLQGHLHRLASELRALIIRYRLDTVWLSQRIQTAITSPSRRPKRSQLRARIDKARAKLGGMSIKAGAAIQGEPCERLANQHVPPIVV
jgi:CII-binding regulator of phage lambda lysogenization HflD